MPTLPHRLLRRLARAAVPATLALACGHALALVEDCDHGVNFSHGGTTRDMTATVRCVERDTGRPYRDVSLRDGVWDGPTTWFHPDTGRPERIEQYRGGRREGLWRRFDREGRLIEENSWHDDRQVGVYRRFDPDGRLRVLGWASGGDGAGVRLEYDEQGRLSALQCAPVSRLVEDAVPCGHSGRRETVFPPDRRGVQRSVQYLNGRLDGISRDAVDGQVVEERYDVAGEVQEVRRRIGTAMRVTMTAAPGGDPVERYTWFDDGRRKAHARFEQGRPTLIEAWWQNGEPRLQAVLHDRDRADVQTFHDTGAPNERYAGRLRRLERSLDAWFEPDGDYRSLAANGKPLMSGRWAGERFVGESNEYDAAGVLRQRTIAEADGSRKLVTFDAQGRPASEQWLYPDGSRRAAALDDRGAPRIEQVYYPDGSRKTTP